MERARAEEGRGMRTLALVVAAVLLAVSFSAFPVSAAAQSPAPSPAGGPAIPILYLQVIGETVGTKYEFTPSVILLPQVPIVLNVTFYNNQSTSSAVAHTFTINDAKGNPVINTGLVNPQANVTFQFTINSMTNITYSNRTLTNYSFTPGPYPGSTDNGTIQWYCIPHSSLGMVGTIMLATAIPTAAVPQKGVLLRAYWIGMIGIAAMLVWIVISYFVIKSSSPHFKDHKAHVRKGLP